MKESDILKQCMLTASQCGATVFRNNVGIAFQPNGQIIRYGLCNGSSDLIGWMPVTITPEMVGKTLACFVGIEVKTEKGRPTDEQINFLDRLAKGGGFAMLAKSSQDVQQQLNKDFPEHVHLP
jgi:hypothetical protein